MDEKGYIGLDTGVLGLMDFMNECIRWVGLSS